MRIDSLRAARAVRLALAECSVEARTYQRSSCDFVISESEYETVASLELFLKGWNPLEHGHRQTPTVCIQNGGGSINAALRCIDILAKYEPYLTWEVGLASAGSYYWYAPQLKKLWIDDSAFIMSHRPSTDRPNDLPWISSNYKAMASQHGGENTTCYLSYRVENLLKYYQKDCVPFVESLKKSVAKNYDTYRMFSHPHYVEFFSYCDDHDRIYDAIVSEVFPTWQEIDNFAKMFEEAYEFTSAKEEDKFNEAMDLIHSFSCYYVLNGLLPRQGVFLYPYVQQAAAYIQSRLSTGDFVMALGIIRNWEKAALRRDRPVPINTMIELVNRIHSWDDVKSQPKNFEKLLAEVCPTFPKEDDFTWIYDEFNVYDFQPKGHCYPTSVEDYLFKLTSNTK